MKKQIIEFHILLYEFNHLNMVKLIKNITFVLKVFPIFSFYLKKNICYGTMFISICKGRCRKWNNTMKP